jgi:hypothetical protein
LGREIDYQTSAATGVFFHFFAAPVRTALV